MAKTTCLIMLIISHFVMGKLTPLSDPLMIIYTNKNFVDSIENGGDLGPNVYAFKLLFEEMGLPESLIYVPHARAHVILDQQQPACLLFKIKTQEREQKYLFSKPVSFSTGRRLYQNIQSDPIEDEYLNQLGQIKSVATLLKSRPKELIVLLPNFSYGDILDRQISEISEQQKVTPYTGDLHGTQAAMFFKKRSDFALLVTPEVRAFLYPKSTKQYRSYAIENVSLPITVHVMCNKTDVAKKWLEELDNAILKVYQNPSYTKIYAEYHTNDEVIMIAEIMRKHHVGSND